jgi:hypothetical protein
MIINFVNIIDRRISNMLLNGEAVLSFEFVCINKDIDKIDFDNFYYSVYIDFTFSNISEYESFTALNSRSEIIKDTISRYLNQFGISDKTDEYFQAVNSIKLSTRHMLPESAIDKKYDFDLLYEFGLADSPDYIIVTHWKAKLTDLIMEIAMKKEKIRTNKTLSEFRETSKIKINTDEDCRLVFSNACCCRCSKKDKGYNTCCNGEFVINQHGYCEDFSAF